MQFSVFVPVKSCINAIVAAIQPVCCSPRKLRLNFGLYLVEMSVKSS